MANVALVNLKVSRGATFRHRFVWQDDKSRPINLTGYTAKLQIREQPISPEFEAELTTENGGIVLGGRLGTISLYLSSANTESLTSTKMVYDLKLRATNGDDIRLVQGQIVVSQEVTR